MHDPVLWKQPWAESAVAQFRQLMTHELRLAAGGQTGARCPVAEAGNQRQRQTAHAELGGVSYSDPGTAKPAGAENSRWA
jgi:hypothetical protein